jgi:hypothetical protein
MYLDQSWICKMLLIVALEVLQLCTWELFFVAIHGYLIRL